MDPNDQNPMGPADDSQGGSSVGDSQQVPSGDQSQTPPAPAPEPPPTPPSPAAPPSENGSEQSGGAQVPPANQPGEPAQSDPTVQ